MPPVPPTHLLYLHGFRSSPRSFKAVRLARWLAEHRPKVRWWCPQLPPSPRAAMALLAAGTADWPDATSAVVGSSLGGYYATRVAAARGWRAVLLNPAVDPARDLAAHVGSQTGFHDPQQHFVFGPEDVAELAAMGRPALPHPERVLAIVAKGDEVLSWREMAARYEGFAGSAGSPVHLVEGSDHALSDFESHLPRLLRFLGLTP